MYTVEVRDHIMIAHSFRGDVFGPAQALHGATFVVDAAFISKEVDENNIVIDIGRAHDALKEILQPLNYKNLDDDSGLQGRQHHDRISHAAYLQPARGSRARRQARPRRQRTESDPRHHFGIACGARVLRGRFVVRRVVFAVPGDLDQPTGGYAYDKRIIEELRALGWDVSRSRSRQAAFRGRMRKRGRRRMTCSPKLDAQIPVVIDGLGLWRLAGSRRRFGKKPQTDRARASSARVRIRIAGGGCEGDFWRASAKRCVMSGM